MKQNQQILLLVAGVVVLGAVIAVAVVRDVQKAPDIEPTDCGHDHAEGEICPDELARFMEMAGAQMQDDYGAAMPAFEPLLPPARGDRTIVRLETSMGDIDIALFDDLTPVTAGNFIDLAESNFYDGCIFHRVIKDFAIQSGDPTGTGTGGPGYTFADEFIQGVWHNQPGVLSMANAGTPNSNGSQFFITVKPEPRLDRRHTVFGQVIGGMDVVMNINQVPVGPRDRPLEDVTIERVTIIGTAAPGSLPERRPQTYGPETF